MKQLKWNTVLTAGLNVRMFGNRTFVVSVSFDRTFQNKSNLSSLLCPYLANVKSLSQVQRELYWQVIIWQQNWPGNIKREKLKSLGKSKSKLNRSPVLKYLWVKVTFRDISNCQETSRDPQTEMLVRADREKTDQRVEPDSAQISGIV